jgi:hypothetical protein
LRHSKKKQLQATKIRAKNEGATFSIRPFQATRLRLIQKHSQRQDDIVLRSPGKIDWLDSCQHACPRAAASSQ